ncbi:MAG: hypothetical protein SPI14_05385 [Arcanobacterium sp.]|nr:hypothetical protein [Arcanobacterium sp.]
MQDIPIVIELSAAFVPAEQCDLRDLRELLRGLSADLGYDPQLDEGNEFLWAFHDATFARVPGDSSLVTITVLATIAYQHSRVLVPLIFWVCQSVEILGTFDLGAITVSYSEGYDHVWPRRYSRHMAPPPSPSQSPFTLEVELPTEYNDQKLRERIERIGRLPFPGFSIDSALPLHHSVTTSTPITGNWWQLTGYLDTWNYLEIGYLMNTIQEMIPDVKKTRLIRR